jgi:small subunit ribosomal protein S21
MLCSLRVRGGRAVYLVERDVIRMIRVEARGGEPLEKTLRRFKKQCEKEGLTKDIKKTSYYEKPSEKRRRRLRNSVRKSTRDE